MVLVIVSVAKLFWKLGEAYPNKEGTKAEFLRLAVLAPSFLSTLYSGFLISLISGLLRETVPDPGSSFYQMLLRDLGFLSAFSFRVFSSLSLSVEQDLMC